MLHWKHTKGPCTHGVFFPPGKRWRSAQQCWDEELVRWEKKCCAWVLLPWQQYLNKGRCLIHTAALLLLSAFCLKSYFYWVSVKGSFPSYLVRMISLIIIWTRYHGCREQTRSKGDVGAWHEQTQTNKQAFLSLLWKFLSNISYSCGTRRQPTPASPPSLSPDQSTTLWLDETTQQSTTHWKAHRDITSAFFESWEVLNFKALRAAAQKRQSTLIKHAGHCAFSLCNCLLTLSSLRTTEKRCRHSAKNALWTLTLRLIRD